MRSDDSIKVSCLNGKLQIGDMVLSIPACDYPNMVGVVIEIYPLGSPEHDSGNPEDDVLVNFNERYFPQRVRELEKHFSRLYGIEKTFEELPIDSVIMSPTTLLRITGIGEEILQGILAFEKNAQLFGTTLVKGHKQADKTFQQNRWDGAVQRAVHIGWKELDLLLSNLLSGILGRQITAHAFGEEYNNWATSLISSPLKKWELELLFQVLRAGDHEREANWYEIGPISELSQGLSRELASCILPFSAEDSLPDDDGVWFLSGI